VLAHQFFNGANKLELENCRVVLVNEEIQKIEKLKEVLGKNVARLNKIEAKIKELRAKTDRSYEAEISELQAQAGPLVIVCGATGGALSTLAGNIQRFKNGEKVPEIYLVSLPEFGEERHEMMDDMAAIYGTRVFNHMRGMELKTFVDADFGSGRLSVKNGMVFCFSDRNIDSHIEFVKEQGRAKRLALLTGGIGIIRIGGETELESTNNQEIIDDTVRAVGSAMESGVVPGGGRCLESLGIKWLRGPKEQIWKNADKKCPVEKCSPWRGRVIGGEEVDLLKEGIIDPAKVVISSVRSAGSAAIQFMTTKYFLKYDA
jgi:chaperonin GroEL